jgi:D-serine deaminase-like pyridoxal phosphate-dependent protein
MIYPGHVWDAPDQQGLALRAIADRLAQTLDLWQAHGLKAEIVSGGSTPTAFQSHLIPQLTEIRPGTYIFNDMNTVRGGFCTLEDCAARIVCTVVSNTVPNQVVIDAGTKTLTSDRCLSSPESGHGYVVEYPEAKITRLSEEHGQIDVSGCSSRPRIGERVTVIPNHICPCVNLQDTLWLRNEDGSMEPLAVDARGKLS